MPRFLIEVPHDNNKAACRMAIQSFIATGSHFMTNADWGCADDEHKAWITVDADSKAEALTLLPPMYRRDALIVALQRFTSVEDLDQGQEQHGS